MSTDAHVVVCVPGRNEAKRLPVLLAALAAQTEPATVLIALNNTSDRSVEAIAASTSRFGHLHVIVDEITFPPQQADAGHARRRAMELGAAITGDGGILITTDADTRPPPNWIAENVAALRRGLDIVGGRIVLDEAEHVAELVRAMISATARYWAEVRAIEDALDPLPWDLPPRHGDHTGASLAIRAARYLACGGVPPIESGEDRALVQAVCAQGGKLGHPSAVWTRVSARTAGRAKAGMAEAMLRLLKASEDGAPTMLPQLRHWEQRARWRKSVRDRFGSAEVAKQEPSLRPMPCDMAISAAADLEKTRA